MQTVAMKMSLFSLIIYHFVMVDVALSLALAGNKVEMKNVQIPGSTTDETTTTTTTASVPDATTTTTTTVPPPVRAEIKMDDHKKPIELKQKEEELGKSLPQKRGVLQELYYKEPINWDDNLDMDDGIAPENLFSAPSPEIGGRSYYHTEPDESAFLNDDGYVENDGRRKRTAMLDEMYGRPQEYYKSGVELTPEDAITFLRLLEQSRLYGPPFQSRKPDYDNTIDSIEADMRDEGYKVNDGSSFNDMYDSDYDNPDRYPPIMKRYMITRRKKSRVLGNPKLRIPVYRRAIL